MNESKSNTADYYCCYYGLCSWPKLNSNSLGCFTTVLLPFCCSLVSLGFTSYSELPFDLYSASPPNPWSKPELKSTNCSISSFFFFGSAFLTTVDGLRGCSINSGECALSWSKAPPSREVAFVTISIFSPNVLTWNALCFFSAVSQLNAARCFYSSYTDWNLRPCTWSSNSSPKLAMTQLAPFNLNV